MLSANSGLRGCWAQCTLKSVVKAWGRVERVGSEYANQNIIDRIEKTKIGYRQEINKEEINWQEINVNILFWLAT